MPTFPGGTSPSGKGYVPPPVTPAGWTRVAYPERLGWKRTAWLAIGGGVGAAVGVLLAAAIIHALRRSS